MRSKESTIKRRIHWVEGSDIRRWRSPKIAKSLVPMKAFDPNRVIFVAHRKTPLKRGGAKKLATLAEVALQEIQLRHSLQFRERT
jgi:hypothetical protein